MKILKSIPVFKPDKIINTNDEIFSNQIKYFLNKQIQIQKHNALIQISTKFPLYLFDDHLYYRGGLTYYGIKFNKLKDIVHA